MKSLIKRLKIHFQNKQFYKKISKQGNFKTRKTSKFVSRNFFKVC